MQKFLRSSSTAILSAVLFFFGSIIFLMQVGLARFDNYEYYGNYPALYLVPPLVAYFLPSLLAWVLRRGHGGNGNAKADDAK
jgi:hypothetical protein